MEEKIETKLMKKDKKNTEKAAKSLGLSVASYVRMLVLEGNKKHSKTS